MFLKKKHISDEFNGPVNVFKITRQQMCEIEYTYKLKLLKKEE